MKGILPFHQNGEQMQCAGGYKADKYLLSNSEMLRTLINVGDRRRCCPRN
jgi:hypothetical protein